MPIIQKLVAKIGFVLKALIFAALLPSASGATPYTMTVPGTGVTLPTQYPEAGGVAIVLTGANGNIYYQFSDPTGAFFGFQSTGSPAAFRGNPFTINDPIPLDCGFRTCTDYFGGSIARMDVRFTAYDGDTQPGGFDENDISLIMNGVNVGSWSGLTTQVTNNAGTSSVGANNGFTTGFGNNTLNTAWFSSTNATLLGNILATGQTTTQVYDDDPNDNYWDFRYGNSLSGEELRTIAPGYELEKSRDIASLTYATVGQVINYDYVVRNIGSVDILNVAVVDDKITSPNTVTCNRTTLPATASGGTAEEALCTASYTVTQADIDNGTLTNVAIATGTPEYGVLGALQDTVTLTGPTFNNDLELAKVASPQTFNVLNQQITYTFTLTNKGNTTLTNVVVTDPKLPSLSCTVPSLSPQSGANTATCTATYAVTQADIDNADQGLPLVNTASATARDPKNATVTATAQESITGPNTVPAMTVEKVATTTTYDSVGDVINFQIKVTNTGIMTWPQAPTIADPLTGGATCPAGTVAPNATVTCTTSYTVTQADLDNEEVVNTATASIVVNGQSASASDDVTVPATVTPLLSIDKTLSSSSPNPYSATTDVLVYSYVIKNEGNVSIKDLVVADNKVAVTCPVTTLAVGASTTCTSANYAVTQADLNAGSVTNVATANANTAAGDPVAQVSDTVTVPADQNPAMTLDKVAETIALLDFVPNNTVDYTYTVTNSGNVTITDAITIIDDKFTDPISCPAGNLAPTAQRVCTATYTITAADVAEGFVTNTAYAKAGSVESPEDQATVPQEGTIGVTLAKAPADPAATFSATSDSIAYVFTVTNTGDVALSSGGSAATNETVTISDPQISGVICSQPPLLYPVSTGLAPSSMTCTGTFSGLTQAHIDAGEFTNTAKANVSYLDNGVPKTVSSAEASATVPADVTPSFTFTKTPPSPAEFTTLGQSIPFTFAVTNTSTQTIASVVISDPAIPSLSCPMTNIAPSTTRSCTANYTVTQADMDAGTFTNVATATGTSSTGAAIPSVTDDATIVLPATARMETLTLNKIASTSTFAAVGDEIDYMFQVHNTGNVTLTNISVTDTPLGFSCTIPTLAVGATDSTTCTATKVITQAEIDAGTFVNAAQASTAGGASGTDSETATGPTRTQSFTLTKASIDSFDSVGDTVNFTFAVKNTGNTTLTGVTVTDTFFTPNLVCNIGTLAPNATDNSCTASYVVDQDDLDAGEITNTASVAGDGPLGALTPKSSTAVVTAQPEVASFTIDKVETDGNGAFGAVGTNEAYGFAITNTGLVTLKNITIVDPLTGLNCAVANLAPNASTTACANATPFASSYTITQADVDAGALTNVVTVNATTTQGTALEETDTVILAGPTQAPALTLVKSSTAGAGFSAIGDSISYSYVVTNAGNITITAPITIADDRVTVSCPALPSGGLAPQATLTCTATDTVDQADLDAGNVVNNASANVSQPVVPSTLHPTGTAAVSSPLKTVTVAGTQLPALSMVKRVKAGTPATYDETSDIITFEFVVTNSGNVTTTGQISVFDSVLNQTVLCGPATGGIAPNETAICEVTWSPTQNDIDVGEFTNSAVASMPYGSGTTSSASADKTVYAVQRPEMTVDKVYLNNLTTFSVGDIANYEYTITNTGNETIVLPVTIVDNLIPSVDCSSITANLAPGDTGTCTGSYTVGVTDVQLGSAVNVAYGSSPTTDSETVSEIIPQGGIPAMSITKTADVTTFTKAGDKIKYTYAVTNTSTGSPAPGFAKPITIVDDKFAQPIDCWISSATDPDVKPGETVSCEAEYTVTQADMDAIRVDSNGDIQSAFVKNVANGKTEFLGVDTNGQPATTPVDVVSAPQSVRVDGVQDSSLLVEKSASGPNDPALVGDTITFTITVTNDGQQTISAIEVEDPMLTGLTCEKDGNPVPPNLKLAPAEFAICEGTYVVLQSDIDAQVLENTATAQGTNPSGGTVEAEGETEYPVDPIDADVKITKSLAFFSPAEAYAAVGQEITFVMEVENTGNVTLATTTVTDILFPGQSCVINDLAPNAIDNTTCSFTYEVKQTDIDAGRIVNTATAEAQPATPGSDTVDDSDTITGIGPDREPSVSVGKAADVTVVTAANDPIVYTYTIANTGNVSLTSAPVVVDDKITAPNAVNCPALPPEGILPTETLTCTATYLTTQNDVDRGYVTNVVDVSIANPLGGPNLTAQDTETVSATRSPELSVVKTASDSTDVVVGQLITYTYEVTNTGNTRLFDVTLSDEHTHATGTSNLTIANNVIAVIQPDQTVTRTATYRVTQADIDAGADLTNTVTATATAPNTAPTPTPATADEVVTVEAADPKIEAFKTAAALPANPTVGTPVDFTITVENIGNVTLDTITLADTLKRTDNTPITPSPIPTYQSGDSGIAQALDVGETWTYTVRHLLTQEDFDAGGISNSVRATGTPPSGPSVSDLSDNGAGTGSRPTTVTIPALPKMETRKRISANPTTLGATVRFEIEVENTGNVTLSDVIVSDEGLERADGTELTLTSGPSFFSATLGSPEGTIKVGETATYRATYVLTQEDIDAGGIENSASAQGSPPVGSPIADETDAPVELPIAAAPAIEMEKSLLSGGPTYNAVGDVLTYAFEVTNTGNVTITDQITIADPLITNAGGSIVCPAPPLAPLDSLTCEGSYTVTQANIDAGKVDNRATASAGDTDSPAATETVPALLEPALETKKKAVSITVDGVTYPDLESEYFVADAVVEYTYEVTNTGNVTLTDPITVTDNRIASVSCPALPTGGLRPTQSLVCTASDTITATDVRLTSVTNAATARAGDVVAPIVTETIPADGEPLLSIEKSLLRVNNPDGSLVADDMFDEVGDVLTYEFTITNDGTISFVNDVVVDDARLGAPLVCFTSTSADPDLRSNESVSCQGSYTVVQDDLDAGEVFNEALAKTLFGPDGTEVISDPDTVTTAATAEPSLLISKSAATLPITGVGQVLTYTLTLENDGNQTLTDIRATDPLIPDMSCRFASLAPEAVETCTGTYTVQQSDIDAGELVNTASVRAITPAGNYTEDDTSLVLDVPAADPELVMTKVGSPDPFGAVGSAVTYVFTLENKGNVTLYDLVVTDEIADPTYRCTVARLDVGGVDDSCTLSYIVTQDDVDAGRILNEARVSGRDPFAPIAVVSATSEIESQPASPTLDVTKTASLSGTVIGSRITFDLYVRNTGDVSLTLTGVTDTMEQADGTPSALTSDFAYLSGDTDNDGRLDVTEVWRYQGYRTIDQADIDAGGMRNSARVDAVDPFGTATFDVSDDGDDLDGNREDDATFVPIVPGPALDAVKTVGTGGSVAGDTVTFQITATNVGNVSLTNVTVSDEMRRADGTDVSADIASVVLSSQSGSATEMAPNDVWTWTVSYVLTQEDVDAGGLLNTAVASGTPPTGPAIYDRSDNGIDDDGNTTDDETSMTITAAPQFDVVKRALPRADDSLPVMAGEVVSFEIDVTNNGNVTLSDLALVDTMTNAAGTVIVPDSITLTEGASETEVMTGETLVFTVLYTLTQDDIDAGGIENTATVSVLAPSGVALSDISDDGDDTDGNTLNDPTVVPIAQFSSMEITKEADIPVRIGTDLFEVDFTITVTNTGNVSQTNLIVEDDLAPFVAPASLSGRPVLVVSNFDGSGLANASYNGISAINLLGAGVDLLPENTGTINLTVTYDTSGNQHPEGTNTAVATSDLLLAGVTASVTVVPTREPDIVAIKTVTPDDVMLGSTVTYTITFENRLDTAESNLTIIDDMPAGVIYTPNSARYNGAETPAPEVVGRQLRWSNITLAPRERITVTFDARVVGERGEMVNRAYMLDGDGAVVSNVATATITRSPEAVFECSDIIGKVFDDRNMNGYQDGAVAPDNSAVTDQTYDGNKGKLAPEPEPDQGSPFEPGLPNVRLATVNGTIITTDRYGRYSVPCAELAAADIGSNFLLKLDERSLPTGYRVTTENPRSVRVTAGTVAKLNFGAAIANVVDIDLMAGAFQSSGAIPSAALVAGVDQLVRHLRDVPSVLRLSYYMNGEGRDLARQRLDAVEDLVRSRWRENGRYRLLIERTIRQLQ